MHRLAPETALAVLRRHDLIDEDEAPQVVPLSGGVSAALVLVTARRGRFVLKQPQPEFAVADRWVVDTGRGRVEFAAARLLHRHLGRRIVPVLVYDHVDDVLVLEAAPQGWRTWKAHLLAGQAHPSAARAAGRLLAGIHALGALLPSDDMRHDALFDEQRLDPYLRTSAARVPEAAAALLELEGTFAARDDLVHGDFSPKNLFVDPAMQEVRLIDHEVVTRGDAAFDVGFLLAHLVLKSIHLPDHRAALHDCARVFLDAYQDARPDDTDDPLYAREARAVRWAGACLLARVVGKSPVEYLDEAGRDAARRLALHVLGTTAQRLDDVLDAV